MNIFKMSKEDLELLSFTDIAYEILKKEKNSKSTVEIFRTISELLGLSEDEFASKIGEFYTTLTTDKRFYALTDGNWDLKDRHSAKIVIDDEDEEDIDIDEVNDDDDEEENNQDIDYDANEDYEDNDLEDLVVISHDENEEEE